MAYKQTESAHPRRSSSGRPRQRSGGRAGATLFWLLLSTWLIILIGAAAVTAALFELYRGDRVLASVHVLGTPIGGIPRDEAAAVLQGAWDRRNVVLDSGDARWTVPLSALGITLDADATVRRAYAEGRVLGSWPQLLASGQRLLATVDSRLARPEQVELQPIWRYDPAHATRRLRNLAEQIAVPPNDATLKVVEGRVETTPATEGQGLDVAATLTWIESHATELALQPSPRNGETRVPLAVKPLAPAITDVDTAAAEVTQLMSNAIDVRLYDPIVDQRLDWRIEPAEAGRWLTFHGDPAAPSQLTWAVEPERVRASLLERNETLGEARYADPDEGTTALIEAFTTGSSEIRLRVHHGEGAHTVQAGETLSSIAYDYGIPYPWIQGANPEIGDLLREGSVIVIPSPDLLLPLPVVEGKRIVVSLNEQRMWAYENGAVKWEWPVSTGITSSPTSPGIFQVQSHEVNAYAANWDLWMPFFVGFYHPVPGQEFMNGFHGFPTRGDRQLLWTKSLGRRVTYGCVLVSTDNEQLLYAWAEEGVIVEVQR